MKRKSLLVLFFKVFILLGVLVQGVYLFVYQTDLTDKIIGLFTTTLQMNFIIFTLLLMLLNWSLEALKWQFVIKWVKEISFLKAIKTVLLGLAFSFFTPRGIGEYFARAYTLDVSRKLPVVLSLFIARMTQLFVLITGGVVGCLFMLNNNQALSHFKYVDYIQLENLTIGVIAVLLTMTIVLFLVVKFKVKIRQVFNLLKKSGLFSVKVLSIVTGVSLIRYCTYCSQFVLLVLAFGVEEVAVLSLFSAVMFTFFMKALVPVFNFMSDLGVREIFSVVFLSMVGVPVEIALSASLLLWCINIVLPTIAGSLLVFKTKISW